jgi:hypothetical protein
MMTNNQTIRSNNIQWSVSKLTITVADEMQQHHHLAISQHHGHSFKIVWALVSYFKRNPAGIGQPVLVVTSSLLIKISTVLHTSKTFELTWNWYVPGVRFRSEGKYVFSTHLPASNGWTSSSNCPPVTSSTGDWYPMTVPPGVMTVWQVPRTTQISSLSRRCLLPLTTRLTLSKLNRQFASQLYARRASSK